MSTIKQRTTIQWIATGALQTFAVVILMLLWQALAFSQMGSSSTYSDSWTADDGTIFGAGVTADYNNGYGHTYWTVTTLRSPSGRTSTTTSYNSNSYNAYARAETSLPFDWNDMGDYVAQSNHWLCCPYMGGNPYSPTQPSQGCFPFTNTSIGSTLGASHASYDFTSQSFCCCYYHIIPNCSIRCGPPDVSKAQLSACAAHVIRTQAWYQTSGGTTICIPNTVVIIDSPAGAPPCYDEGG